MLGKAQTNGVDADNNPLTQEAVSKMLRESAGKLKRFFEARLAIYNTSYLRK